MSAEIDDEEDKPQAVKPMQTNTYHKMLATVERSAQPRTLEIEYTMPGEGKQAEVIFEDTTEKKDGEPRLLVSLRSVLALKTICEREYKKTSHLNNLLGKCRAAYYKELLWLREQLQNALAPQKMDLFEAVRTYDVLKGIEEYWFNGVEYLDEELKEFLMECIRMATKKLIEENYDLRMKLEGKAPTNDDDLDPDVTLQNFLRKGKISPVRLFEMAYLHAKSTGTVALNELEAAVLKVFPPPPAYHDVNAELKEKQRVDDMEDELARLRAEAEELQARFQELQATCDQERMRADAERDRAEEQKQRADQLAKDNAEHIMRQQDGEQYDELLEQLRNVAERAAERALAAASQLSQLRGLAGGAPTPQPSPTGRAGAGKTDLPNLELAVNTLEDLVDSEKKKGSNRDLAADAVNRLEDAEARLQARIKALEGQLKKAQAAEKKAKEEAETRVQQLLQEQEQKIANAAAGAQDDKSKAEYEAMAAELEKLKLANEKAKEKEKAWKEKEKALQEEKSRLEKEVSAAEGEDAQKKKKAANAVKQLEDELEQFKAENKDLKLKLADCEGSIDAMDEKLERAGEKVKQLKDEVKELKKKLGMAVDEEDSDGDEFLSDIPRWMLSYARRNKSSRRKRWDLLNEDAAMIEKRRAYFYKQRWGSTVDKDSSEPAASNDKKADSHIADASTALGFLRHQAERSRSPPTEKKKTFHGASPVSMSYDGGFASSPALSFFSMPPDATAKTRPLAVSVQWSGGGPAVPAAAPRPAIAASDHPWIPHSLYGSGVASASSGALVPSGSQRQQQATQVSGSGSLPRALPYNAEGSGRIAMDIDSSMTALTSAGQTAAPKVYIRGREQLFEGRQRDSPSHSLSPSSPALAKVSVRGREGSSGDARQRESPAHSHSPSSRSPPREPLQAQLVAERYLPKSTPRSDLRPDSPTAGRAPLQRMKPPTTWAAQSTQDMLQSSSGSRGLTTGETRSFPSPWSPQAPVPLPPADSQRVAATAIADKLKSQSAAALLSSSQDVGASTQKSQSPAAAESRLGGQEVAGPSGPSRVLFAAQESNVARTAAANQDTQKALGPVRGGLQNLGMSPLQRAGPQMMARTSSEPTWAKSDTATLLAPKPTPKATASAIVSSGDFGPLRLGRTPPLGSGLAQQARGLPGTQAGRSQWMREPLGAVEGARQLRHATAGSEVVTSMGRSRSGGTLLLTNVGATREKQQMQRPAAAAASHGTEAHTSTAGVVGAEVADGHLPEVLPPLPPGKQLKNPQPPSWLVPTPAIPFA